MSGAGRWVFSDVDETLIAVKSMLDFLGYYWCATGGRHGARRAADIRGDLVQRARAGATREALNRRYYRAWAGEPATQVAHLAQAWYLERSVVDGFYVPCTRRALQEHRAAGDTVILVSGSFPALLAPIAAAVGAARVLCSVPEIRHGVLTGHLVGEPCIGQGKRTAVCEALRGGAGVDPARCYAYGDHISDLPMLAQVGHPVIVGGSAELAARLPQARILH